MIENRCFQTSSVDTRGAHTNMAYTRSPERRLGAAPPQEYKAYGACLAEQDPILSRNFSDTTQYHYRPGD